MAGTDKSDFFILIIVNHDDHDHNDRDHETNRDRVHHDHHPYLLQTPLINFVCINIFVSPSFVNFIIVNIHHQAKKSWPLHHQHHNDFRSFCCHHLCPDGMTNPTLIAALRREANAHLKHNLIIFIIHDPCHQLAVSAMIISINIVISLIVIL